MGDVFARRVSNHEDGLSVVGGRSEILKDAVVEHPVLVTDFRPFSCFSLVSISPLLDRVLLE